MSRTRSVRGARRFAVALAVVLLTPIATSGQAGGRAGAVVWDSIGVMPDSQKVYLHTRSFERTSQTALQVWTHTRSRRPREIDGIEYDRMLLQVEYDCAEGTIRFIWMNLYREDRLVESDRLEDRADPLAVERYREMLQRSICTDSEPDPG